MVRGCTGNRPRIMERNARVSAHDMPILRRATLAISLSTCTLILPPAPISFSARSALAGSPEARTTIRWCRRNYRAFASSRSNLKSAGRRPRNARRRFSSSSRPGLRDTPNSRSPATWISISSPSFSSRASTTEAGRRTARLLPHFATCMSFLRGYTLWQTYIHERLESRIRAFRAGRRTSAGDAAEDGAGHQAGAAGVVVEEEAADDFARRVEAGDRMGRGVLD